VTGAGIALVLDFLLVFARIGAAFALLPGFGNVRVPAQVRLFLALAVSLALTPIVAGGFPPPQLRYANTGFEGLIAAEAGLGLLIGVLASLFLQSIRFAAAFIANCIGLAGIPGQPVADQEAMAQLPSLLSLAATMMIFASGLHIASIQAIVASYGVFGLGELPDPQWALDKVMTVLRDTTLLAVQIAGPFMLFAVSINFALGLAGRFTPQLQVYFTALGLITLAGLLLLWASAPQLLTHFAAEYWQFLASFGGQ
jgi:flagellar biosynthetic protein FliR